MTPARHAIAAAIASLAAATSQSATIVLNDVGGVTGSQAELGFTVAAQFWGGILSNSATINLDVGFSNIGNANVIAQAGSRRLDYSVADWKNAVLATQSSSTIDSTAVLPTLVGGGVTGNTVGVDVNGNNDVDVSAVLNGSEIAARMLYANSSLLKALGVAVPNSGNPDAALKFNTQFAFDFDPSDGITANTMDFIGVAIHEMGHALGFVSGVDFFDVYSLPAGPGGGIYGDLNDTSLFSALDMFRYGSSGELEFRPGHNAFFSIDGGASALMANEFATGRYNGDGDQASHWKDAQGCSGQLGIMDPTFCYAQMGEITGLDLAAFDAMGWNLSVDAHRFGTMTSADIYNAAVGNNVPEPATWALMLCALGLAGASRRKASATGHDRMA